jgi:GNAT superfamily N-acetyltransferase
MKSAWTPSIDVRIAGHDDIAAVSGILREASEWADTLGAKMWQLDELSPARLAGDVEAGLFHLAWDGPAAAGTIKFQLSDPEFWPDDPGDHAAYVHRLAVWRRYAKTGVSTALLQWAAAHARTIGRQVLRLDCDEDRISLRNFYEQCGFRPHSCRQVGPYYVMRYELPVRLKPDPPHAQTPGEQR